MSKSHAKRFVQSAWTLLSFQFIASVAAVAVTGLAAFHVQQLAVRLEADYATRHVVFVARGAGPFGIEYGRRARAGEKPASAGPSLALPTLLPGYREGDEWKLPEAAIGKVVAVNPGAVDKTLASEFDLKKSALWAMLVVAVLILGAMAWRLLRDSPPSKKE